MLQLNPPIPVITPKGKAIAHFMIDDGIESHLQWVCFQDDTGECWTWNNTDIRAQFNITHGRVHISPFRDPDQDPLAEDEEEADQLEEIAYLQDISREQTEKIQDCEKTITKLNENLKSLKSLIGKLIRDDHIFGASREIAKQTINAVNEDDEDELPY